MSRLHLINAGEVFGTNGSSVAIKDGRIESIGSDLPPETDGEVIDCDGRALIPGFVDSHTHIVFAGDRADEFAARLGGASYQDIAAAGGGIGATVSATRACSEEDLYQMAVKRIKRMIAGGTTTIEIKSGYGLNTETELKILRVARRIGEELPITVATTFLGAHSIPPEYRGDRAGYLRLLIEEMLPEVAPLSDFCDVFVEQGVFSPEEGRMVLERAAQLGMRARLHAEQLTSHGGARLAADLGAMSADHLDHISREEAYLLAESGVVAGLVPGASYSLRSPQAPARMLVESGVTLALATDCNPGTSYFESMGLIISLAVVEMGLSVEEAVTAATAGGAASLGMTDRGSIEVGAVADLVILDAPTSTHLAYRPATPLVWKTIKDGQVAYTAPDG